MSTQEIPLSIDCQGETLVAIIHRPEQAVPRGVLAMAAGGPQYRAGCCRQLLHLGRRLAECGVPVMRVDYRGIGDASGPFGGFTTTEADLRAAIEAFRQQVPGLREIVLWGGCDAASASMIHGWRLPLVGGMILGNPFVHSEETGDKAMVKHYYLQRLREPAFWKKVLSLRFNPLPAFRVVARVFARKLAAERSGAGEGASENLAALPFQARMRIGMERFDGHVLLLISGRSLVSAEFDELLASDQAWQKAMQNRRSLTRHDLPEADQAFSTIAARDEIIQTAIDWLQSLDACA